MQFSVLTYNMLCKSLGSNCIPWVMVAAPEIQARVEKATGQKFSDWKTAEVQHEYSRHFHKNMASGDYVTMRGFWSALRCKSQDDIPPTMTGVKFHAEDQVAYVDKTTGSQVVASTLRGVLRAKLPAGDLGVELFDHLMEAEEHVYAWPERGPRVFAEILRRRPLVRVGESREELQSNGPDLVLLQEYDVINEEADYHRNGANETFGAAMFAEGYGHVLFKDPFKGREPPQGHGVFFRRDTWELDGYPADGRIVHLECGEHLAHRTRNVDFEEQWHKLLKEPKDGKAHQLELMDSADRRNLALVRLRHKGSGRPLWLAVVHLMTTSRDHTKTNRFPGEVRAGELRTVRAEVAKCVPPGEALLLLGDFNTDVRELSKLTKLHDATGEALDIEIGLDTSSEPVFRWQAATQAGTLVQEITLRDAFAGVHRWGEGVGPAEAGGCCTSVNAARLEWIDYVWYSDRQLRPVGLSPMLTPPTQIPSKEHGSDHLPLAVLFEFHG